MTKKTDVSMSYRTMESLIWHAFVW